MERSTVIFYTPPEAFIVPVERKFTRFILQELLNIHLLPALKPVDKYHWTEGLLTHS
jgi:hypothetical protein